MKFLFLSFTTVLFSISCIQAQNPLDPVNLSKPDSALLEVLTFHAVNELRHEKNLQDLIWDDVLIRAAKDHADYLIKEKKLSHYQTIKGKRTPADRVKIHGGIIYSAIGENIVEIPLGKTLNIKGLKRSSLTYQSSAKTMALAWKNSPGHYKNIISKNFNCSAIAVTYDSSSQRLIAVQVFAYAATPSASFILPDYSEKLMNSDVADLPYKLKNYKYKNRYKKSIKGFENLMIDRGCITGSYKTAKKTFRGRRSGITQEFISITQFDSASKEYSGVPNRRNGMHELNGKLTKPVYRRKLLKYSRQNTEREYLIDFSFIRIKKRTTMFVCPLYSNSAGWEYNLFLLKSKRLVAYRTYINVPGELFTEYFPDLTFENSFKELERQKKYDLYNTFDTLTYKIYYSPGEVEIRNDIIAEISNSMSSMNGKIIHVNASAFASVEGEKEVNEQLAKKRMAKFMDLITPFKDSFMVAPKLIAREQWIMFNKQITGTKFEHLKKLKRDDVRAFINKNKKDSLLMNILNEERYMEFTIIWKKEHKDEIPLPDVKYIYDSLALKINNSEKKDANLLREMEKIQMALYFQLSRISPDSITLPDVPEVPDYPVFNYHKLIFRYWVLKDIPENDFYYEYRNLVTSKEFPSRLKSQAIYNNLVFLYQQYLNKKIFHFLSAREIDCSKYRQSRFYFKKFKNMKCFNKPAFPIKPAEYFIVKEIPNLITRGIGIKGNAFPNTQLKKYYYIRTIELLYPNVPLQREIFSILPQIKPLYHPIDSLLTDEERLRLAFFYNCFRKFDISKSLLEPIAMRKQPNLPALKLYLTLLYDDYKDEHEYILRLINEFPRLGKTEWCDLWYNPDYLNFLLLEDLELKNFYNCNCK